MRNRQKSVWDRSGFWLFYKRLEEGTFRIPGTGKSVEISVRDLLLVLEGIELRAGAPAAGSQPGCASFGPCAPANN
jgi:transposase